MHQTPAVLKIGNMHFTSRTPEQAMNDENFLMVEANFLDISASGNPDNALDLFVVYSFCEAIRDIIKSHPESAAVVVCPQDDSLSALRNACMLFGAYLLLCADIGLEEVVIHSKGSLDLIDERERSGANSGPSQHCSTHIPDCWRALHQASALRWIGQKVRGGEDPTFDSESAAHYAQPSNGSLRVLSPGKLLLFPTPSPLPDGQGWADESEGGGQPPARRFGAGFLAGLLADLGVSAVACLGRADAGDAAAFRASGLDVHGLGLDPRRPALLPAMDRLLAVSRSAPGPVALYYSDAAGREGARAEASARTLAAAWLMREWGFGAGAAAAWVRMALTESRPRAQGSVIDAEARQ